MVFLLYISAVKCGGVPQCHLILSAMGVTVYKLARALRTKPAHVVSSTVHVSVFLVSMVTTVSLTVPWGSMENNVKKDVTVFMARFVRL